MISELPVGVQRSKITERYSYDSDFVPIQMVPGSEAIPRFTGIRCSGLG
jgi:hypothetical protein